MQAIQTGDVDYSSAFKFQLWNKHKRYFPWIENAINISGIRVLVTINRADTSVDCVN